MTQRTPEEWRDHLLSELGERRAAHEQLRRYRDGEQLLPTAPDKANEKYQRLAQLGITNMCGLIVDTVVDRLIPKGVAMSSADAPAEAAAVWAGAWERTWESNGLDGEFPVAAEEALTVGRCPMLIWPVADRKTVAWTVEDPDETVVEYAPESRSQRVAALKTYKDCEMQFATLWLPEEVHAWVKAEGATEWSVDPDASKSGANPLGVVPVLELVSKRDVKGRPKPEISNAVIRLQDRINKTMFDAVVGAEDGAFPQRVTIGIEIETDADGNPINPLKSSPSRVWALDPAEGQESSAKIDQFEPFQIDGLLKLAETSIRQLAAISKTSVFYVLAGLTNVGADTIRMADAASTKKARGHLTRFSAVLEEGFRLAMKAVEAPVPATVEIDWEQLEMRSPAELADAAIKLSQAGYPFAEIARYMGATQDEVARIEAARAAAVAQQPSLPTAG